MVQSRETEPDRVIDNPTQPAGALYYDAYDLGVQKTLLKQADQGGPNLPNLEIQLQVRNPLNPLDFLDVQDREKFGAELDRAKTPAQTESVINQEISLLKQPADLPLKDALKNIESSSKDFNSTEAALDKSLSLAKTENQVQSAVKQSDLAFAAIEKHYANTGIAPEVDFLAIRTQEEFKTVDSLTPKEIAETGAIDSDLQSGNLAAFKKDMAAFHNDPSEFDKLFLDSVLTPANPGAQSYTISSEGPDYDKHGAEDGANVTLSNVNGQNQQSFSTEG